MAHLEVKTFVIFLISASVCRCSKGPVVVYSGERHDYVQVYAGVQRVL